MSAHWKAGQNRPFLARDLTYLHCSFGFRLACYACSFALIDEHTMSWSHLDDQMKAYHDELTSLVRVGPLMADRLATSIASEVRFMEPQKKKAIRDATPVKLSARLDELGAFQSFMESVHISGLDQSAQFVRILLQRTPKSLETGNNP
jgi:hypothetical protein